PALAGGVAGAAGVRCCHAGRCAAGLPQGGGRRAGRGRPGLDRRAGTGYQARREGPDRGVNALASTDRPRELIHRGMTSRDLTENVEQMQLRSALALVRTKVLAVLVRLA